MVVTEEQAALYEKSKGQVVPIGGWATFDDVTSQAAARQDLALPNRYKPDVKYVIEFEVVKPLEANIGFIGKQTESSGQLYRGGSTQAEFSWDKLPPNAKRQDYLKPTGEPKPLKALGK